MEYFAISFLWLVVVILAVRLLKTKPKQNGMVDKDVYCIEGRIRSYSTKKK